MNLIPALPRRWRGAPCSLLLWAVFSSLGLTAGCSTLLQKAAPAERESKPEQPAKKKPAPQARLDLGKEHARMPVVAVVERPRIVAELERPGMRRGEMVGLVEGV